jgi:hypothetical protein
MVAGDVSESDASYTISAHLTGTKPASDSESAGTREIEAYVRTVVSSVANAALSAELATERLIALRDHIERGQPLAECHLLKP